MSRVCPSGPHAAMLERAFENPGENVCFSIRAFTRDYMQGGVMYRDLDTIVTFDYVNEPGIDFAEKFKAPSLEAEVLDTSRFTRGQMTEAISSMHGVAQESTILTANELFTSLGWNTSGIEKSAFTNW